MPSASNIKKRHAQAGPFPIRKTPSTQQVSALSERIAALLFQSGKTEGWNVFRKVVSSRAVKVLLSIYDVV